MKKKGFTLVELLAVIAILAILVIIALPNIMTMFNSAKRNTFINEIKRIYRGAEQAYVKDSFDTSGAKVYSKIKSGCTDELDMSMRDDLDYYIRINSQGKVDKFYARDNSYQFEFEGDMDINDLDDVEDVSGAMERVKIECNKVTMVDDPSVTQFIAGEDLNIKMKSLAGDSNPTIESKNTTITAFVKSTERPNDSIMNDDHVVSTNESYKKIYMWFDNGTIYYWSEEEHPALNRISSSFFRSMISLSNISGLNDVDTSHVRDLERFLYACSAVTSIEPFRNWNTKRVENLSTTFGGGNCGSDVCLNNISSLKPLENWNTSRVTNMSGIFQLNAALTNLEGLENWNTSNVTNMRGLFLGARNYMVHITNIEAISNWNTSKVTTMAGMFQANIDLRSLASLKNWDVSNVTNMQNMFSSVVDNKMSIESLAPLANWDTSKVTSMRSMFQNVANIESLEGIENWNTSNVEDFDSMFDGCSGLVSANLSNWDMSKAKYVPGRTNYEGVLTPNGAKLFNGGCTSLKIIITPKAYPIDTRATIPLPNTFMKQPEGSYSILDINSPTQTELRTSW